MARYILFNIFTHFLHFCSPLDIREVDLISLNSLHLHLIRSFVLFLDFLPINYFKWRNKFFLTQLSAVLPVRVDTEPEADVEAEDHNEHNFTDYKSFKQISRSLDRQQYH